MNAKPFRLKPAALLAAAVFSALSGATATNWYANASMPDDTGNGLTPATAKQKIESAVALAGPNDTVNVAAGNYSPASDITVDRAITITSANGAGSTFVNGGGAHRCFYINHTNAVVDGFTLTNGLATSGGGAYVIRGMLRNSRLTGNSASSVNYAGGGAYIDGQQITFNAVIENCVISNNATPGYGGGLLIYQWGTARGCQIVNNTSTHSAVYMRYGGALSNSTVRANYSRGIFAIGAAGYPPTVIADCLIADHAAGSNGTGAGIYFQGSSCTGLIVNTTISNNWTKAGAGVAADFLNLRFDNCRIVDNTGNSGAGVYIGGSYVEQVVFSNCLIAGNVQQAAGFATGGTPGSGGVKVMRDALAVEFTGCVISNNSDELGGGGISAVNYSPVVTMRACDFVGNSSLNAGGGLSMSLPRAEAINCTFRNNYALQAGGGVSMSGGLMHNCLVTENESGNFGAGINMSGGTVDCCTVVANIAVNNAGGMQVNNANPKIYNTIIFSNAAASATTKDFRFSAGGGEQSVWYCCYRYADVAPPAGRGNTTNNPLFNNYTGANFRLTAQSPCINAGTNRPWMAGATDLDGRLRLRHGAVDMGAYEWLPDGTVMTFY